MRDCLRSPEPARWWGKKRLGLFSFIVISTALSLSCSSIPEGNNPALPLGFETAPLPDVALNGYLYLDGSHLSGIKLVDLIPDFTPPPDLSGEISLKRLSVWLGTGIDSLGIGVEFTDRKTAELIEAALQAANIQTRHYLQHDTIYVVKGRGEWAEALFSALREARFVRMSDTYVVPWKLLRLLPGDPPAKPIAAGFGVLNPLLLERMERDVDANVVLVRSIMSTARARNLAFALYPGRPLQGLPSLNDTFLTETELSGIMVTRSSYPGFLVSFIFGRVGTPSGLTRVSLSDGSEDLFHFSPSQGSHFMIKNRGNIFTISLASNKEAAEDLIKSSPK